MQLIKGFLLLFLIYLIVTFLGMGASSYIMRMIFNNILIILVILFGPEIRKILEQIGKGKARNLLKGLFNSGVAIDVAEMKKTIDATCKACAEMSDAKIGALIVFENDTLLALIGEKLSAFLYVDSQIGALGKFRRRNSHRRRDRLRVHAEKIQKFKAAFIRESIQAVYRSAEHF